jgi:phosphopantothenoylcysteine decarboxylase/phosphopantothenate--cysteine ligase
METRDLLKNARKKLESKHCDLLVANSLKEEGAGFGTDTNVATLLWPDREETLPMMSKKALAHKILDALVAIKEAK